jgi:single-strand DNA-binding protein
MAKSLNKVQLIGNLGRDPEMKFTPSGRNVATFTVAMNRTWKNGEGQEQSHTEWVNLEAWGRAAEIINQYAKKGSKMYVEGRLQTDRYTPAEGGADKFFTKVVVQEFMFLGDGRNSGERHAAEEPEGVNVPAEEDIPF